MKKSRILKILLFIIIVTITTLNVTVCAEADKTYTVSDTINATLSGETLTVSGTGEIPDYSSNSSSPWTGESITKIVIGEGITKIGNYAFRELTNLTSVELSNTVLSIGAEAFENCSSLEEFTCPSSLELIDARAFSGCIKLKNISLNEGLTELGSYAFNDTVLESLYIPSTVTRVGTDCCLDVVTLKEYSVAEGNTYYFANDGVLYNTVNGYTYLEFYPPAKSDTEFTIPDEAIAIRQNTFANAKNLKTINIPSTMNMINAYAFRNSGITSIYIPDTTLEVFGPNIFEDCTELETVVIEADIDDLFAGSKLQSYTFSNCTSLKNVTITGNVETFYSYCFYNCTALETIKIPEGTKTISYQAFYNCTSLKEVIWSNSIISVSKSAFVNCTNLAQTNTYPEGYVLQSDNYYRRSAVDIKITGDYHYDMAKEVLELVNQNRESAGVSSLVMDEALMETATQRAAELAVYYEHTRPNYQDCFSIFPTSTARGENIAAGYTTAAYVMNGWMNSSGHKANILSTSYSGIGIGCFYHNGKYFWVQCFGTAQTEITNYPENETKQMTIPVTKGTVSYSFTQTSISVNDTETFKVKGLQVENSYIFYYDSENFVWNSSDETILVVDQNGNVTGKKPGKANINITTPEGTTISQEVTVTDPNATIKFVSFPTTIVVGQTLQLETEITTNYDFKDYTITWSSLQSQRVSVDSNGVITAKKAGETYITAKLPNGKYVQSKLTAIDPIPMTALELDKTSITIVKNKTTQLTATITPSNTTDNTDITWSSSNTAVATVDENGNITAKEEGTAIITAEANGFTATCNITVSDVLIGDVNGDGDITLADYAKVLAHVKKINILTDEKELYAADVNEDEDITLADYAKILAYVKKNY